MIIRPWQIWKQKCEKLTKEGVGLCILCSIFIVGVMSIVSAGWAVLIGLAFLAVLFLTLWKI